MEVEQGMAAQEHLGREVQAATQKLTCAAAQAATWAVGTGLHLAVAAHQGSWAAGKEAVLALKQGC
jgi:hypothetical protein